MRDLPLKFDHGLGDCVHFAHMLQLAKQAGYAPRVHYQQNKRELWEAAGIPYCEDAGAAYHAFKYVEGFNLPTPEPDYSGAKAAHCFAPPLPDLGAVDETWERLCKVDLSKSLYTQITQEQAAAAARFVEHLPRPIVLLHTNGTNWIERKNLPTEVTTELYGRLLDGMPGTIVLLDWDNRVPRLPSLRVRHIKDDWGHLSIGELAALYRESDLLIGVDSGPYHLSAMTQIPALGVFTGHYPSCVTLPRTRSAVMTRDADSYRPVNQARRIRWSILEYPGATPSAAAIAKHALRMLKGCRYLTHESRIGRDVMLQQWVRDWLRQSSNLTPRADRDLTIDWLLRETTKRFTDPHIVETGCCRSSEDWSAGYSTYIWGAYLDGLGVGRLDTVDIDHQRIAVAQSLCKPWQKRITFNVSDSVRWLEQPFQPIDVLYLDSMDTEHPEHAQHCIAEIRAALPRLHDRSIVAIDDTVWDRGWKGKGSVAVPWMLEHGWRLIASGYQCVLERLRT
jgi:hypothetical protein